MLKDKIDVKSTAKDDAETSELQAQPRVKLYNAKRENAGGDPMNTTSGLPARSFKKDDWLSTGAVAAFAAWNGLAFRMVNAPVVSLPWSFLSFPRRDEAWLIALATVLVVALLVAASTRMHERKKDGDAPRTNALLFGSALCMTLGSIGLTGNPDAAQLALACGALCGAGMAMTLCVWMRIVAAHVTPRSAQRMMGGFALACIIDLAVGALPAPAAQVLVSALPIAWCICLTASLKQPSTPSATEPPARSSANTLTLCVAMFGFAVFMGILGFDYDAIEAQRVRFVQASVMAGGAAVAAGALALLSHLSDIERIQIVVPLLLTTAFVLLPISTGPIVREIAVALAQSTLLLSFVVALFAANEGKERDASRRFPFLLAALAALNLGGVFVGGVIRNVFGLDATALTFTALLVVYFVLLIVLPLSRRKLKVEHVIRGASIASPAEIADIRCQALAERYPELSAREKDVLCLMLQNYSNARMAETLVVSESTVKTHIRHVYAKMGIRSRQQLFAEAEAIPLTREE